MVWMKFKIMDVVSTTNVIFTRKSYISISSLEWESRFSVYSIWKAIDLKALYQNNVYNTHLQNFIFFTLTFNDMWVRDKRKFIFITTIIKNLWKLLITYLKKTLRFIRLQKLIILTQIIFMEIRPNFGEGYKHFIT